MIFVTLNPIFSLFHIGRFILIIACSIFFFFLLNFFHQNQSYSFPKSDYPILNNSKLDYSKPITEFLKNSQLMKYFNHCCLNHQKDKNIFYPIDDMNYSSFFETFRKIMNFNYLYQLNVPSSIVQQINLFLISYYEIELAILIDSYYSLSFIIDTTKTGRIPYIIFKIDF